MFFAARTILTGRNTCHVDDAVQNACIAIAENINLIKMRIPQNKLRAFIIRVVKNKAIDIMRREKRRDTLPLDDTDYHLIPDPLDEIIEKEDYENLLRAVMRLDEKYRTVLEFKLIDGLSTQEIAQLLNISQKNVNVRIFRAKKMLRFMLRRDRDNG